MPRSDADEHDAGEIRNGRVVLVPEVDRARGLQGGILRNEKGAAVGHIKRATQIEEW